MKRIDFNSIKLKPLYVSRVLYSKIILENSKSEILYDVEGYAN